jgi:vanillate O-demethylase monooxygenase subunit
MANPTDASTMSDTRSGQAYPRDQWWVAAYGAEVGRTMISRWILGRPVLLYRTTDGSPVALDNRCAHRSFPLSKGTLHDDHVVCGYHGYQYDPSGACVKVPAQERVPPRAKVHSYPIRERGPFLWIWTGDPTKADDEKIPLVPAMGAEGWCHVTGYYNIRANWLDLHENLLDLTHFSYLHDNAGTPEWASVPGDVSVDGDVLTVSRVLESSLPPSLYGPPMNVEGHKVDRWSVSEIPTPAVHIAHAKIVDREPVTDRTEYNLKIIHAITPEGTIGLHQFWAIARDFSIHDEQVTEYLNAGTLKAFVEDVDALESIADLVGRDDRPDFAQVSTMSDKAGHQLRKIVSRLVAREVDQA